MNSGQFNSETARAARAKSSGNSGENRLKRMFREYADSEDVKAVFDVLKEKAVSGDMDAVKVFLSYMIGKPRETVDMSIDAGVQIIFEKAAPNYETK